MVNEIWDDTFDLYDSPLIKLNQFKAVITQKRKECVLTYPRKIVKQQ